MIRAITFDVGGTLIEPRPSVGHVYAKVAARRGIEVSPDLLNRNFAAAWKAKRDFSHRRSDWAELVEKTFAGLGDQTPTGVFFDELFDEFALAESWRIFDDVLPALGLLGNIKMAIISNWDERLRILLPKLSLERYFDPIIISCEEGFPKPNAVIFESASKKLGLSPEEILHVGDSYEEDVAGARLAGFKAVWLTRKQATSVSQPEAITTLVELTRFIG